MSLLSYAEARPWARSIKTKVTAREMPPWHADPQYGVEYATDRSLKPPISRPSSNGRTAAPLKATEGRNAPVVSPEDGWTIKPDMIVRGPAFEVPAQTASNVIEWTTIIVPGGFTKDTWITSVEIKPSNLKVTYHMCIGFVPHREDVRYYTPVWADKPRDAEGVEHAKISRPRRRAATESRRGAGAEGPNVGGPAQLAGVAGGGFLCYLPGTRCSTIGRSRPVR